MYDTDYTYGLAVKHGLIGIDWEAVARCEHADAKYLMELNPGKIKWLELLQNSADWVFDLFRDKLESYAKENDDVDVDDLDVDTMFEEIFTGLSIERLAETNHAWVARLVETFPIYFIGHPLVVCMQNQSEPMIRVMNRLIDDTVSNKIFCETKYTIGSMSVNQFAPFSSNESPLAIELIERYLVTHPTVVNWGELSTNPAAIDLLIKNPSKVNITRFIDARRSMANRADHSKRVELVAVIVDYVTSNSQAIDDDNYYINHGVIVIALPKKLINKLKDTLTIKIKKTKRPAPST
jgi:hypothetical protein